MKKNGADGWIDLQKYYLYWSAWLRLPKVTTVSMINSCAGPPSPLCILLVISLHSFLSIASFASHLTPYLSITRLFPFTPASIQSPITVMLASVTPKYSWGGRSERCWQNLGRFICTKISICRDLFWVGWPFRIIWPLFKIDVALWRTSWAENPLVRWPWALNAPQR